MSRPDPANFAEVVLRRHRCLNALVDRPQPKRELVKTLDTPRSTLDDIVRELEQIGLVEYDDGIWQPTFLGKCVCDLHEAYLECFTDYAAAAPVLDPLPNDTTIDVSFLHGVDVYEGDPAVPDAVMSVLSDHIEPVGDVRIATPIAPVGVTTAFYDSATSGKNCTFEMILPEQVISRIHDARPTLTTKMCKDPNGTVHCAQIPFTYGVWIGESDHAGIIVFEKRGICGLLVNDTDAALEWAADQYNRVKRNADPMTLVTESQ